MKHLILTVFANATTIPVLAQVGPNIDELAKDLSNSGAANAPLNFKLEYRTIDGALPDANDQDSVTATFQPNPPTPPVDAVTRAAMLSPIRN